MFINKIKTQCKALKLKNFINTHNAGNQNKKYIFYIGIQIKLSILMGIYLEQDPFYTLVHPTMHRKQWHLCWRCTKALSLNTLISPLHLFILESTELFNLSMQELAKSISFDKSFLLG